MADKERRERAFVDKSETEVVTMLVGGERLEWGFRKLLRVLRWGIRSVLSDEGATAASRGD